MKAAAETECVAETARAGVLLHPLRLSILERARTPTSASEVAEKLGLPRQRVNYHVRELHRVRFLRKAGRRKKRNIYEQRYVASARAYVLAPEVLGPVGADPGAIEDRLSASHLLALSARLQSELARVTRAAARLEQRVATLSMDAELRFESPEQRERFAVALRDAVARIVAEHASPASLDDGRPGNGRPYRLVLGCYPQPGEDDERQ